jgi:hypothetical protein
MGLRRRNQTDYSKDSKDGKDGKDGKDSNNIRDPVTWTECLHAIHLLRKVDPGKYTATVATVTRTVDASVSSPVSTTVSYSIGLEQPGEDMTNETRDVIVTITNVSGSPLFFPLSVRLNGATSHMIFLFPEESKQEPNIECPATPTIVAPLVPPA